MSNFKKIFFALTIILLASSCRKNEEEQVKPKKQVIEVSKPADTKEEIKIKSTSFASKIILDNLTDNDRYKFSFDKTNNFASIEQGNFDIAIVPAYLAPFFYNKTDKSISMAAITQTGNIYVVSNSQISNQSDFRGKTILIPDPASKLSKIVDDKLGPLKFILRLDLKYYKSMDDIVKKMDSTNGYVSILTEPYYTKSYSNDLYVSKASNMLNLNDDDLITEVIIVNNNYLKDNKSNFDDFLKDYRSSLSDLNEDSDINEEILEDYNLSKKEAESVIDNLEIIYIDNLEMKDKYNSFLDKLEDFVPEIFDGNRPGNDLYYID